MKYQNYKQYKDKRSSDGKFYYLYKITNLINSRYYYGVHSTYSLSDGYWGSGILIKQAIRKYGKENFRKDFLEFFNNSADMYKRESDVVNEAILNDPKCYNLTEGGHGSLGGYIFGKDKETGEFVKIKKDDPRWISREVTSINKGMHPVYDIVEKKHKRVTVEEMESNPNLIPIHKNTVMVYDTVNKIYKRVDVNDPKRETGEYISGSKNKVTAFDTRLNKYVQIDRKLFEMERKYYKIASENKLVYRNKLTGEVKQFDRDDYIDLNIYEYITKGHKTGHEGMIYVRDPKNKSVLWVQRDDPKYLSGELIPAGKNNKSTRGRVCINNGVKNMLLWPADAEEYIKKHPEWIMGNTRKFMANITKDKINKSVPIKDLDYWLSQGWKRGQYQIKPIRK